MSCAMAKFAMRTKEGNVGIAQMTTLLNAGYPLSDALRLTISKLVSAAARAAARTRSPNPPVKANDPTRPSS